MIHRILFALLAVVIAASCSAFTPPFDPKEWPCGSPQMHFCPGTNRTRCCYEWEDCGGNYEFLGCPAGMCCYNGRQAVSPDGGKATRMRPQTEVP